MIFADHALAQRLEAAEGYACAQFAVARKRIHAACDSAWMRCAGADVVFDGVDAPTTQTFGLGMFEPLTEDVLTQIEEFFLSRKTTPMHEVCPFAGPETLDLLCARGYRPFEISNVLYRTIDPAPTPLPANITVRIVEPSESELWASINARGWAHDHPEFEDFLKSTGTLLVARENSPCFLASSDGTPAAAGALSIYKGIALFAGAATVPEFRRRGLQSALLAERMRSAAASGCDLAMMVALPGSDSQRNAERQGFRIAYTRLKWKFVAKGSAQS